MNCHQVMSVLGLDNVAIKCICLILDLMRVPAEITLDTAVEAEIFVQ